MRILALEDTLSHQVRMETILAEIADENGVRYPSKNYRKNSRI